MINDFLLKNWFDLLQSIFIFGGFMLSFIALRNDIRSRKIEHLFQINQSYREIWSKTYTYPELLRIRETDIDLKISPITEPERRMIREMIIHIYAIYEAIQNNQIEKGETVGYNRSHIASSFEKIATIPIGHADGISRQFGNGKGYVFVNNQKAAIIGNVCMDMIMVNITDVDCEEGDEVIIFDGIHKASTFAEFGSTISYEVLTAISQRVKRLYAK